MSRGIVVDQFRFEHLERSTVGDFLVKIDRKMNKRLDEVPERNLLGLMPDLTFEQIRR